MFTAKGLTKLATNPVLNPLVGLPVAALQGKNPLEAYKEGGEQLKDIGTGLLSGYKQVYNEHGIAGLAGYLAPDVALAVLTGGESAGAKGAAEGTARAVGTAKWPRTSPRNWSPAPRTLLRTPRTKAKTTGSATS